ncbi:MAG: hypothetical protein RR768_05625 [Clostridium sp.]
MKMEMRIILRNGKRKKKRRKKKKKSHPLRWKSGKKSRKKNRKGPLKERRKRRRWKGEFERDDWCVLVGTWTKTFGLIGINPRKWL